MKRIKDFLLYDIFFSLFVWIGHNALGFHKIDIENSKDGKEVMGIRFFNSLPEKECNHWCHQQLTEGDVIVTKNWSLTEKYCKHCKPKKEKR